MNKRGVALMSVSHVVDDSYQGVVPALLPFFVADRHYSYAAVSGLTLAATLLSSVAQPAFGWWTDRRPRRWLIGAGILTAAAGVGVAGLFTSYAITCGVPKLGVLRRRGPSKQRQPSGEPYQDQVEQPQRHEE